ncbi:MAG: rhodanese-like domain-containing protein [Minwuiales bacterium]|nr:rhodanese-like domain-containing protein [Minwuiales bacterium]
MITNGFKKMLAEANAVIETTSVQDALGLVGDPNVAFIDIRETVERQQTGSVQGAVHAPRGLLEFIADPEGPMHNDVFASGKKLLLFCASGGRSALAAKTLQDMGLGNVAHIAGGYAAWREAGGPVED